LEKLRSYLDFSPDEFIDLSEKTKIKSFIAGLKPFESSKNNKNSKQIKDYQEHLWMHFAKKYFHFRELNDYLNSYSLDEFFPLIRIPNALKKEVKQNFEVHDLELKTIAFIPATKNAEGAWPLKNWVKLFRLLEEPDYQKYRVLLMGSPADIPLCDNLIWELPGVSKVQIKNLTGKLNTLETAVILSECDLVIGGDTELFHLASSVGAPTIGLFKPGIILHKAPFSGIAVQAEEYICPAECSKDKCQRKTLNCLESLTAEEIWLSINEVIR
jgi:ADP-heptose:LPS heptosyltransferase